MTAVMDANTMMMETETANETAVLTTMENRYTSTTRVDDDDDESSKKKKDVANINNAKDNDGILFSPELLGMYYSRLFPFHLLYSWLSYDPSSSTNNNANGNATNTSKNNNRDNLFARREFSYTIVNDGEEIYLRYNSFATQKELRSSILCRRPVKIDIGAIFDRPPRDKKAVQNGTIPTRQRELVFDIDLTDYDDVRFCGCTGAAICRRCWTMMTMAIRVMDDGLRQDFGFRHVAWFYSGRRGVHAWVCDESARTLSNEARSAVASYFEVNLGTEKNSKVFLPHPLHPMMVRAFSILEPMFVQNILPASGHGLLADHDGWTTLFKTLPDAAEPVKKNLLQKWSDSSSTSSPAQKWFQLKDHLQAFIRKTTSGAPGGGGKEPKTMTSGDRIRIENWPTEVVFRYTYPRLDINVSKMQNHLLKSPFCVHPKTGRVCVPVEVEAIDEFDPFTVPTLPQLMRELDEYEETHKKQQQQEGDDNDAANNKRPIRHDWQKTSLKQSFEAFEKKFLEPMTKELRRNQRDATEEEAATTGDF